MAPRTRQGLQDPGLYDARDERDACGFGMVVQLDDQPSRSLVDTAIAALSRMTHRGGVAADGLTGDGCGLLIRKPDPFLRALAREAGIAIGARYAAGLVSLPHAESDAARCREELDARLRRAGAEPRGWRVVPT
ncbi:MAG: hypothetical protein ABN502_12780, partial [Gammaproteobacteria bacterium]